MATRKSVHKHQGGQDNSIVGGYERGEFTDKMLHSRKKPVTKPVAGEHNKLTEDEERVLVFKGTERAFVGEYTSLKDAGTFACRRCNLPLYQSDTKFESHCGWPSFDAEIAGSVHRKMDSDGFRMEILCSSCGDHLRNVFSGEGFTKINTRYCVNSLSMKFYKKGVEIPATIKGVKIGAK